MKTVFSILLFLAFIRPSGAQSVSPLEKTLDSLLQSVYKPNEPGMAVLVAKKGTIVYEKAIGSANLEQAVPLKPDMVFRVGSITKQFTAIAILQLMEQQKLSLSDSVQRFLPDFPFKGKTITIEHLLTHTSGLPDFMAIDHPDHYVHRHELKPSFLIDHFKGHPLQFEPGSKYGYSNSNYVLLAAIIENVSGKPYRKYMKQEVLEKAGMNHSYYPEESDIVPGRVLGYTWHNGRYYNSDIINNSLGYGAGDLFSSMPDLFKWNTALWNNKLVKKETLKKAFTPHQLANGKKITYGYGWFIDSLAGLPCIKHEGQVFGFISAEFYFPTEDVFVAFSTNVQAGEDTTDFSGNRFGLMFKIPVVAVGDAHIPKVHVPFSILDKYVGIYEMGNRKLQIIRKGDEFLLKDGHALLPLRALTDRRFLMTGLAANATAEFILDKKGTVTEMRIWQNGEYNWKKIN
jgi:CubicO group peptidase (beta-lactamase class C family)